jgi:3-(3-hydroxy-phenyl)propionate hydroxylase
MALTSHYPVIIVGAGPTGLTLANLLGEYGVRCLLVERNTTTVKEPRAVSIDDESLRTLQSAGVIEAVLPDVVAGYGSIYYTAGRVPFAKVEPTDIPYGYPRRNAFRQPKLEEQLRLALRDRPSASTLFGWRLAKFIQAPGEVSVILRSVTGESREVACEYLVGCDGAASTVRTQLDIALEGTTYASRWLIVDLENNRNSTKHTEVFCNRMRPCITLPGPDATRRYEFELLAGEAEDEMLAPARVTALLAQHGADPNSRVHRKVVYRFHARIAPRWNVGRVLLAGDAAHLTPPFAGQGMNSGLRDAHNLAWKLAAVTDSLMGPRLLESYEQERRDHVRQMIDLALRMGRVMSPTGKWSALLTQTGLLALNMLPPARDYITQMRYKPKPRFSSGFMLADGRSTRRTLVGRLLPQPTVRAEDGSEILLDDVIGPRFALLVRTSDPEGAFVVLRHRVWDMLRPVRIALLPPGCAPGKLSQAVIVSECDEQFSSALGRDRNNVILLRPDRYVAACFPLEKAGATARAVETLLTHTWREKDRSALLGGETLVQRDTR